MLHWSHQMPSKYSDSKNSWFRKARNPTAASTGIPGSRFPLYAYSTRKYYIHILGSHKILQLSLNLKLHHASWPELLKNFWRPLSDHFANLLQANRKIAPRQNLLSPDPVTFISQSLHKTFEPIGPGNYPSFSTLSTSKNWVIKNPLVFLWRVLKYQV